MAESKVLLIADFTVQTLAGYLANDAEPPFVKPAVAPFDQVMQLLLDASHSLWQDRPDCAVVWTRPEAAIEGFKRLLDGEPVSTDDLLAEVDEFSSRIAAAATRTGAVLVPAWISPSAGRGMGMLDMKRETGLAAAVMRMNLRLADSLSDTANVYVLDASRWVSAAGPQAINPKLWYMAKTPFDGRVFAEAAADIKAALRGVYGQARKLVLVDLDETLWGGIVGDVGWENIRIGGHDAIGEAYADFQSALRALRKRGILLGIVSKNQEDLALEAIDKHPEMILRRGDFVGWKINWTDKARNIVDLVSELNLGLQSVVFVDDNPVERARVREALPEVLVPDWPADRMLYASTLRSMRCFDTPAISDEDRSRTAMYVAEKERSRLKEDVSSIDEWLRGLDMEVTASTLNEADTERAVQLLNKTNQFNLSTRRLSRTEFLDWIANGDRTVWTFRVTDKYGDSGLTGLLSLEYVDNNAQIVDFVLSCRVMGRRVEQTMLHVACEHARMKGGQVVSALYSPTPKNKPCLGFLCENSGFEPDADRRRFTWSAQTAYPLPDVVSLKKLD